MGRKVFGSIPSGRAFEYFIQWTYAGLLGKSEPRSPESGVRSQEWTYGSLGEGRASKIPKAGVRVKFILRSELGSAFGVSEGVSE